MANVNKPIQKKSRSESDIHVDEKFLQEHLNAIKSEMSWRRDLEFRLVQFLLVFYPIIGTAMVSLFQSDIGVQAFSITAAGASILILAASLFVTDRIRHEHRAYSSLGRQVQKIWYYFGLFEPDAYLKNETILPVQLNDEQKGYGQGKGYKKTLGLIWLIAVAMVAILATLALLKG